MSDHAITLLRSHWSFPSRSEWHPSLYNKLSGPTLSTLMVLSLTPCPAALHFTHSAPTTQASIQFLKLARRLASSQMIMCCMPNYLPAGFLFSVWFLLLVIGWSTVKIALSVIWKHCLETPLIKTHYFLKCIPHALLYNFLSCDPFSASSSSIIFTVVYEWQLLSTWKSHRLFLQRHWPLETSPTSMSALQPPSLVLPPQLPALWQFTEFYLWSSVLCTYSTREISSSH